MKMEPVLLDVYHSQDRLVGGNGLMDTTKIYGSGSLISQVATELLFIHSKDLEQ